MRGTTLKPFRVPATALSLFAVVPATAAGQRWSSGIQLGTHFGFDFSNGEIADERLGFQALMPVYGPLELGGNFGYLYNFGDFGDPRFGGNAWQSYLTARMRPLGAGSFLTLGYGITMARIAVHDRVLNERASDFDATDVGLIGVELPVFQVRPFAELYLVDLLERTSAVGGNLIVGVSYRFR